ncbi:centrobin-like isoform X2 [Corticium candelabrum]|uniref:centrobin-like isoform X2 n=1 Tax=Corticium candelabrum TaxID=121492 RepID=UPI002E271473|nr:centrobin-like isoform X2 [Corticium candelabrum]
MATTSAALLNDRSELSLYTDDNDVSTSSLEQMTKVQKQLESFLKASRLTKTNKQAETDQLLPERTASPSRLPVSSFGSDSVSMQAPCVGVNPLVWYGEAGSCTSIVSSPPETTENQVLCENLDRERLRRKICEREIHDLQKNMLQLQQQLTVTASSSRKREFMIEQLEKTLKGIISGWQQQQKQKEDVTRKLKQEKELLEEACLKHREAYSAIEMQLEGTSRCLEDQKRQLADEKAKCADLLSKQCEKVKVQSLFEEEKATLLASNAELKSKFDQEQIISQQLRIETDNQLKEHKDLLHAEKEKGERARRMSEELQETISSLQSELKKMGNTIERLETEKEGWGIKLQLKENEYQASLMKLRAELQEMWHTELMTKFSGAQEEVEKWRHHVNECHRAEIEKLTDRHNNELLSLKEYLEEELKQRCTRLQCALTETETRVRDLGEQLNNEKKARDNAEDKRKSISLQLKALVQSHCKQVLSIIEKSEATVEESESSHVDDLPFNDIHITAKDLTEVPRLTDSPLSISSMKTSSVESSLISDTEHLQSHHQTLRLSNYDEDQSQDGVSEGGKSHFKQQQTTLSWSRQLPILPVSQVNATSMESPSYLTDHMKTFRQTSDGGPRSSQLENFEMKQQFHEKQQDELRHYVYLLLNRIPSQSLKEPKQLASPLQLSTTFPVFSPLHSKYSVVSLSTPSNPEDSGPLQQPVVATSTAIHYQGNDVINTSSTNAPLDQPDCISAKQYSGSAQQSQSTCKTKTLVKQTKLQESIRRNLEGSFQEERTRASTLCKSNGVTPSDKQSFRPTKSRSQAKPWK